MLATGLPCAIFLVKQPWLTQAFQAHHIPYITAQDYTLTGCRSGLYALLLAKTIENGDIFMKNQAHY